MPPRKRKLKVRKPRSRRALKTPRIRRAGKSSSRKSARKRKPKSSKRATRRSPQKPRARKTAKSSRRKSRSRLPKKIAAVRPLPAQPEEILFRVEGKMSTFGGPHDLGMAANEDLALFTKADLQNPKYAYLFLPAPPPGTSGLGRRLNPDQYYFACRWNYAETPKEFLRRALARVENPANGRAVDARPVDWGPHSSTGRVADLSPGLAAALGLDTDDIVRVTISARRAIPVKPSLRMSRAGHGSSNPHSKPVIKQFVKSPNCSCRNGASIDKIVLHCTEGSLASALAEFQKSDERQVSAHYVIDRNGDIYQMVSDSDRSNHCMGANQNSIGIEHVGSETDLLTAPQAAASAALIRWLLQQYHVPRTNIFGHDFAPGYSRHGGTSCPDRLFGPVHSQAAISAWVEANV
jgi:N-acetylmuramoyl-L-alanine amidase-like protein